MANKFDEEMKKFVKAYTENAKQIAERKEEIETLSTEIAEVEREDREKEAKRLAGIKRASGIDLPPNPISDPRYAAKLRQKQDLEIVQAEAEKALKTDLYTMRQQVNQELSAKEAELKTFESKYLANAKRALDIAEQKIKLGGSEEELEIFNSDKDIATKAIAELKTKSDALCAEVDRMKFFSHTLDVMENGSVDLTKLDKMMSKIKDTTTVRQMNQELKKLTDEKEKESKGEGKGQTPPPAPGRGEGEGQTPPPAPGRGEGKGQTPPSAPGRGEGEGQTPPPAPGRGEGEGQTPPPAPDLPKPEGPIAAIKYTALDSTYEITFANGAKKIFDTEKGAIRDFRKEDKRYLKEVIKGVRPGRYKKCDIGLFKVLRTLDREQGTKNFDEYVKLLNGEDSELKLTYDANKMNDPAAFQNQTSDTRRIMMRVMNRARKMDGIEVKGYKPTKIQGIIDWILGTEEPKRIEAPSGERTAAQEHEDSPKPTRVEEHSKMPEHETETPIAPTKVEEHEMTSEQAKKIEETLTRQSRRSEKGQAFAKQLHDSAGQEGQEYSVEDIIAEVKSWEKKGKEGQPKEKPEGREPADD